MSSPQPPDESGSQPASCAHCSNQERVLRALFLFPEMPSLRIDLRYFRHLPCSRNAFNARLYALESSFMLAP